MWDWDDMSELGRAAYVLNMAASFLSARGCAVPHDLAMGRLTALRGWLDETASMSRESEPSTATPPPAGIDPDQLPPEAALTADDLAVIDKGIAVAWTSLKQARQQILLLRMAIAYVVTDDGGSVPPGLVRRVVEASTA